MIDTTQPVPGPYRPPRDTERRTRLMLVNPWRDCVDVCELNPDLEEHTDATMRLLATSWNLLALAKMLGHAQRDTHWKIPTVLLKAADELVRYVHGTDNGVPPDPAHAAMERVRAAHAAWANLESLDADGQANLYFLETGRDAPGYGGVVRVGETEADRTANAVAYVAWRFATRERLQAELRDAVAALPA